jgi:site-specific DNA-methyltransferase (adenine-specific)
MTWHVEQADALAYLRTLPDSSVDLVCTDPPYFRVKPHWWDRQWSSASSFIDWIGELTAEWARVLRPNGSLYVFASPQMGARVEVKIGETMRVVNSIVWAKPRFSTKAEMFRKGDLRSFFPASERIVFAEHYGADNIAKGEAGYVAKCDELRGFVFEPLRAYLDGERERAGVTPREVNDATGSQMAGHWFTQSQWALPTRKHYETMRALFNASGGDFPRREYDDLRREYDFLRREYDDLRQQFEALRRPFAVSADVPYTDVWSFPTVQSYAGKHPCEKPQALLRHIIAASSRPGGVVLD